MTVLARLPPASLSVADVLSNMADACFTLDHEWRFTYVSDSAERLLGRAPAQLVARSIWDAFPEAIETAFGHRYHRAMDSQEPASFTEYYPPLDAWFEVRAVPFETGLLVLFHDVNELKQAEERLRVLHAEQAALRRVATAVASEEQADDVLARVAQEAAQLLGGELGVAFRLVGDDDAEVAGSWTAEGSDLPIGAARAMVGGAALRRVIATHASVGLRVAEREERRPEPALGVGRTVLSPIRVGPRMWGVLAVVSVHDDGLAPGAERMLDEFAALCATAVLNAESRRRMVQQAATDPLTGLANHRAFQERIQDEVARATRHGRALSLAILDIDHFKLVNDTAGHQRGDELLRRVAEELLAACRAEDVLARIGGDEFALILPDTDRLAAHRLVERATARVSAGALLAGVSVTLSAGVCDLGIAGGANELFRLADGALYWSKSHGRDAVWVYDSAVIQDLSETDRAAHLVREQTLIGINALARAIDAKDPSTRRHSERVAWYAARVAEHLGWSAERVRDLRQAGLVHDIGKLAVPDEVLLKPGRLTDAEFEAMKEHAVLGAQIVGDVLPPEQVAWVRGHHERPDGAGYPDGLTADRLPFGAAILALADAWDVMTSHRPYSRPKPVEAALAECVSLVGRQFDADAVAALEALVAAGLGVYPAGTPGP